MRSIIVCSTLVAFAVGGHAQAAGLSRSDQSINIIFEEGNYVEAAFGALAPRVRGTTVHPLAGTLHSGNMAIGAFSMSAGAKFQISDEFSAALIYDQPWGSKVKYDQLGWPLYLTTASLTSHDVTGVVRYKHASNFSVHAGLRVEAVDADIRVNTALFDYYGSADRSVSVGWLAGVAYEMPEIGLRLAVTYNSEVRHKFDTNEEFVGAAALATNGYKLDMPQSVNFDFQVGLTPKTLLFGGVRWVNWDGFSIAPPLYVAVRDTSLISYDDDGITYKLGIGYRLHENFALSLSGAYEDKWGGVSGNLGPRDGLFSIGVGGKFTYGDFDISAGVRYIRLGSARTEIGPLTTEFDGNDAFGGGLKIGYHF